MRWSSGIGAATVLAGLLGCGPGAVQHEIEERPLDQAVAVATIQEALGAHDVRSATFQPVTLPDGQPWTVDVVGTNLPLAIEFLTAQDRERIGSAVPVPANPDDVPRIVVVHRAGTDDSLYLRVFTDAHFRFEPNPPPDAPEAPYTIREVQARLRRDVADFVAWYRANHAPPAP